MSDQENTNEPDPVEEAAKEEAEERRESETPKKQEPLKKSASGTGRGLSLAKKRK